MMTILPWVLDWSRVPGWVQSVREAKVLGSSGLVSSSERAWRFGLTSLLISGAEARAGRMSVERARRVIKGDLGFILGSVLLMMVGMFWVECTRCCGNITRGILNFGLLYTNTRLLRDGCLREL